MILFHSEIDFKLKTEKKVSLWLSHAINKIKKKEGVINYIFCDDTYLLKINKEFLGHDTYTDIISFDYSVGKIISGDIYISIERVKENAKKFKVSFENELQRVMIHGILHFAGFNDKTEVEKKEMRKQENYYLALFSF